MCLGIPVQIVSVDGMTAQAKIGDMEKSIDLRLLPEARPGDYVILHAGFAMQVIDPLEAKATFDLIRRWDEAQGDSIN